MRLVRTGDSRGQMLGSEVAAHKTVSKLAHHTQSSYEYSSRYVLLSTFSLFVGWCLKTPDWSVEGGALAFGKKQGADAE